MNSEKKFDDDLQIYVFTTSFVIENKSEITFISHDEDGDWQFMSDDKTEEEDARVISLEEMIAHDSSILELADLPLGYQAERSDKYSEWTISKSE